MHPSSTMTLRIERGINQPSTSLWQNMLAGKTAVLAGIKRAGPSEVGLFTLETSNNYKRFMSFSLYLFRISQFVFFFQPDRNSLESTTSKYFGIVRMPQTDKALLQSLKDPIPILILSNVALGREVSVCTVTFEMAPTSRGCTNVNRAEVHKQFHAWLSFESTMMNPICSPEGLHQLMFGLAQALVYLGCARVRGPPVALHVSQQTSWELNV